jgi:Ser/Thr protein kinase RdoA (MazF antagonist)
MQRHVVHHDMVSVDELKRVLRGKYGAGDCAVCPLAGSWEGNVYRVARGNGCDWVLRVLDPEGAARDIATLGFLEDHRYPAPRLIRTASGGAMTTLGKRVLLVTGFVEGSHADLSPATLRLLGERLGELHALDWKSCRDPPRAEMLPEADMETALSWLRPLEPLRSSRLAVTYNRLLEAIDGIAPTGHLPLALIHNDAHPGNALIAADGSALFIDWHGAGVGPPVVDLGFLLISSEIGAFNLPIPPNPGRIEAIVDGYASRRLPAPQELDWLADAMRFRGLLYGAGHLRAVVAQGLEDTTEAWWWERYVAAGELAQRVRERFERHKPVRDSAPG